MSTNVQSTSNETIKSGKDSHSVTKRYLLKIYWFLIIRCQIFIEINLKCILKAAKGTYVSHGR